jgi:hypothetical protein
MQIVVDDSSVFTEVWRSSRFPLVLFGAAHKHALTRAKLLVKELHGLLLGLHHVQVSL